MQRFLMTLTVLLLLGGANTLAQNGALERGDPPTASLITISSPDEAGIVTISGAAGAVFPSAQVAIRNLYTEEVIYTQAGVTGSFNARIYGPGNTPFWISPAQNIPLNVRDIAGSLPGGPGTIIQGGLPTIAPRVAPATQLVTDGSVGDWLAYPGALLQSARYRVYGLHNQESVYLALAGISLPQDYDRLAVTFTLDGATYRALLDPRRQEEAATWERLLPIPVDLGTLAAAKAQAEAIELRIPLAPLRSTLGATLEEASVERFEFIAAEGNVLLAVEVLKPLLTLEEMDGVVYPPSAMIVDPIRFTLAGPVAQGAAIWQAQGRVNQLDFQPGDTLHLQMDVTLDAPALPETLVGVSMVGQIALQPITGADGQQVTGGLGSNNGWSAVLTPSGLPIDNLRSDFVLSEVQVPAPQVLRRGDTLLFGLDFNLFLPEDLPAGTYGLIFRGFGQVGDGERFAWEDASLLGQGDGISQIQIARLPLVVNVGEVPARHLIWSLFYEHPSDGSRGVLSAQDRSEAALSNRVRFNSPTYILPPFADSAGEVPNRYPLEPYLVSMLPNDYASSAAPLLPFFFPGGQLSIRVTWPDGLVDDLGRTAIVQNLLSTEADDERVRFGGQSPLDVYRLTTLNPAFTDYVFSQYGLHTIEMAGEIEDVWGNRYTGGGTYEVLVAELFDMQPGVMPGTPFEAGDSFFGGLVVSPAVPAEVTITARIYPLDGSRMIEHVIEGQANAAGYFAGESFAFNKPGEYVIDYEARYTDTEGRLWAGSLRSAGVIASPDSSLIVHGRRGLRGYFPEVRPAWFALRQYGPQLADARFSYPYHAGDILWYAADSANTIQPGLSLQDTAGNYTAWVASALAGYVAPDGQTIDRKIARDELPVFMTGSGGQARYNPVLEDPLNDAYSYFSVVRPGMTVRQMVLGSDDPNLPLHWDMRDPYNAQIGSGLMGDLPGDFAFMFGGVVLRNSQADVIETAIYGASAFVIEDRSDALGARVYPPYRGAAGGADGGPLLTIQDQPVTTFFHPTGVRPGQVLTLDDMLAVAGQVAPTLPADVDVTITAPSGEQRTFIGRANAVGYFYDPANDFQVDETGVWTVEIEVQYVGGTSAGEVQPPYPTGGVLGTEGGRFSVYVVPPDAPSIDWGTTRQDIEIPGALPYNFNFRIPEGWTDVQVEHTLTIPGFVLRDGPLPTSGGSFTFQHNPTNLSTAFPNVEVDARLSGPAAADPVSLTFAVTGVDQNGQRQIRTRTFTILYDRLLTLD